MKCRVNESLTYELTVCSFPVQRLKHSYSFENIGQGIKVRQTMEYDIKYGLFGKLLDALMIHAQIDRGVKKFFSALKVYSEKR